MNAVLPQALTDELLVTCARDGDATAFAELVRRHQDRLHGLARSMMRNEADALDAVQDAWLNGWRRLESFRGDAPFGAWIAQVCRNACLMKLRRRRRRPEVPLEIVRGDDPSDTFERVIEAPDRLADEGLEVAELGRAIAWAADQLPPTYRAVYDLAESDERSMQAIADELGLTVPNVKTRLHRARRKMRALLADYLAGEPGASIAA